MRSRSLQRQCSHWWSRWEPNYPLGLLQRAVWRALSHRGQGLEDIRNLNNKMQEEIKEELDEDESTMHLRNSSILSLHRARNEFDFALDEA